MKKISIREFNSNVSKYIDSAKDEDIQLTKHGVVVATLTYDRRAVSAHVRVVTGELPNGGSSFNPISKADQVKNSPKGSK